MLGSVNSLIVKDGICGTWHPTIADKTIHSMSSSQTFFSVHALFFSSQNQCLFNGSKKSSVVKIRFLSLCWTTNLTFLILKNHSGSDRVSKLKSASIVSILCRWSGSLKAFGGFPIYSKKNSYKNLKHIFHHFALRATN